MLYSFTNRQLQVAIRFITVFGLFFLGVQTNVTAQNSSAKKSNDGAPSVTARFGAPGKLTGKVINAKTAEPLQGATISIFGGSNVKTVRTDYNGVFSFSGIPSGSYQVSCSYVGYDTKTITDVKIIKDEVTVQDITMRTSTKNDLKEVIVKSSSAKRNVESVASLLIAQKNSASVSDGISAEAIRRTPDRTTSDIMKRVSGASIQDDKFAIIRGLNDRYNAAFINGAPLPSTESDRKAFSFDIFPANMLDNLTIVKTATPDMPGEFAGGIISINTKDIPAKDFESISVGMGYNTQATLQTRKYYKGGKWDWLGMDDGTRGLQPIIPTDNLRNYSKAEQAQFGKQYTNNWKLNQGIAPPNHNFQYVRGVNIQKNQKDYLGILVAATYARSYNSTNGDRRSINYSRFGATQAPEYSSIFSDNTYNTQVLAGLMGNISLKLNNYNRFSFKNLLSVTSDDRVITRTGNVDFTNEPTFFSVSSVRWFTSNKILSSQLSGEHFWQKAKLKINWTGGYTSVNREIPSLRRTAANYSEANPTVKQDVSNRLPGPDNGGTIFSSNNVESIKSLRCDILRDFKFNNYNSLQLKTGFFIQGRNRDFTARYLAMQQFDSAAAVFDQSLLLLGEDKVFDAKNFGLQKNGKYGFMLTEDYKPSNTYTAASSLNASYLMLDARLLKFIRIIGGARIEQFNQKLNSIDDGSKKPIVVDTTVTDILPSANLVISLNAKQNLRFSYSTTLNRPEYRELAPFIFYDYSTRLSISGNTKIERAKINNYDVRYELYPGRGQVFSVSAFYKKITNPIELVFDPNIDKTAKYQNAPEAEIKGAELECRTVLGALFNKSAGSFWDKLTFFGNVAITQSNVSYGKDSILYGPDRSLQGQSPFVYNAGFLYQDEKGYSGTIQVNHVGQRIYIAGNIADNHIWENGRPVMDIQFAKNFEKQNLEFKLNIKDVLAQPVVFFYDLNNNNKYDKDESLRDLTADKDKIFSKTNVGRVISASITYKF